MDTSLEQVYEEIPIERAPQWWREPSTHAECSLHQLAPYIGKTKSSIAGDLIDRYSKKDDLVIDPFAGAGTIPLEAVLRGRHTFAADISPYARILTKAKLSPPRTLHAALNRARRVLAESQTLPRPDLRSIPRWIRQFFHPQTLGEALRFAAVARRPGNEFLMACFLGILHHSLGVAARDVGRRSAPRKIRHAFAHKGQLMFLDLTDHQVDRRRQRLYVEQGLVTSDTLVHRLDYRILDRQKDQVQRFRLWTELPAVPTGRAPAPDFSTFPIEFRFKAKSFLELQAVRVTPQ